MVKSAKAVKPGGKTGRRVKIGRGAKIVKGELGKALGAQQNGTPGKMVSRRGAKNG